MKVKSLLFAAAALLAFSASAEYVEWTGKMNLSITPEEFVAGDVEADLILTEVGNIPNFTLAEAHFNLPEGIVLDDVEESDETMGTNDKGKTVNPFLGNWQANMKTETEGVIFGNNSKKIPVEVSDGMAICHLYFVVDDSFEANGQQIEMFDVKFSVEGGDTYQMPRFTLIEFPKKDAVNDINVNKAVASVKYYNAAGVAADSAFDGVNIVVTKYADGSKSVSKVVK